MQLGFIGLGNMGMPMAKRLLAAGYEVTAFDLDQRKTEQLQAEGARAAASPSALAGCVETILTSLPDAAALEEVASGKSGIVEGDAVVRVVDLSTVGPYAAEKVGAIFARRDIGYVDAPVSGGPGGAARGSLAIMVGASADSVQTAMKPLQVLGNVFVVGTAPGMGQVMKLANNFLAATALLATSEAMVYGVKSGLDAAAMIDVINAASGRNSASQDKFPTAILTGTFDYGFTLGLMCKDLRLFADDVAASGSPISIGTAVTELWQQTLAELGGAVDYTRIIQPLERAAGVSVRSHQVGEGS